MHFNKRQAKENQEIKISEVRTQVVILAFWFVRKYPSTLSVLINSSYAISETFLLYMQSTTICFHFYFLACAISKESAIAFILVVSAGALKESLVAGAPASLYKSPCGAFPLVAVPLNDFI